MSKSQPIKILGLDPGLETTGFGLVEHQGSQHHFIEAGVITTNKQDKIDIRLLTIYNNLNQILQDLKPAVVSMEALFFIRNITSGMKVAQAQGVLRLACHQADLVIHEYTPLQIKMALTGYGRASKHQIQVMVQKFLKLSQLPRPDDVADALAIALTHAVQSDRL